MRYLLDIHLAFEHMLLEFREEVQAENVNLGINQIDEFGNSLEKINNRVGVYSRKGD